MSHLLVIAMYISCVSYEPLCVIISLLCLSCVIHKDIFFLWICFCKGFNRYLVWTLWVVSYLILPFKRKILYFNNEWTLPCDCICPSWGSTWHRSKECDGNEPYNHTSLSPDKNVHSKSHQDQTYTQNIDNKVLVMTI